MGKIKKVKDGINNVKDHVIKIKDDGKAKLRKVINDTVVKWEFAVPEIKNTKHAAEVFNNEFFTKENLTVFGKEYWFFLFISDDDKRQFVTTFGRSNDEIEVNGKKIDGRGNKNPENACVSWYFDKKKKEFPTEKVRIDTDSESLYAGGKKTKITIEKHKKSYSFVQENKGKETFSAKITFPKGTTYSFSNKYGGAVGFFSLYLDFKGKLKGKKIKGKCLVQKIRYLLPFIPWKWSWMVFKDGSFMSYFSPSIKAASLEKEIQSGGILYIDKIKKHFTLKNARYLKVGKKNPAFVISINSDDKLIMSARSYAKKEFVFKTKGTFTYNEYLVELKDFSFEAGRRKFTEKELGPGLGMIENAHGYMV